MSNRTACSQYSFIYMALGRCLLLLTRESTSLYLCRVRVATNFWHKNTSIISICRIGNRSRWMRPMEKFFLPLAKEGNNEEQNEENVLMQSYSIQSTIKMRETRHRAIIFLCFWWSCHFCRARDAYSRAVKTSTDLVRLHSRLNRLSHFDFNLFSIAVVCPQITGSDRRKCFRASPVRCVTTRRHTLINKT